MFRQSPYFLHLLQLREYGAEATQYSAIWKTEKYKIYWEAIVSPENEYRHVHKCGKMLISGAIGTLSKIIAHGLLI